RAQAPHAHTGCAKRRRPQDNRVSHRPHTTEPTKAPSQLFAALNLPEVTSNGKVEGPADASGRTQVERSSSVVPDAAERAPRAHTLLQRPRRQAAGASRPPRTIVRSHPHNHHCARAAWASQAKKASALSVPMEAINEAA